MYDVLKEGGSNGDQLLSITGKGMKVKVKYVEKEKDMIPMSLIGSEDACSYIIHE